MAITKSEDIDTWPQNISDLSEQKDEESLDNGNTSQKNLYFDMCFKFQTKAIQSEQKTVINSSYFGDSLKKVIINYLFISVFSTKKSLSY